MSRAFRVLCGLGALAIQALPLAAEEFPASNVTLLAHLPLSAFPSNPSSANDCWGYVAPSGREYALVGLRDAVAVVEITDAATPVIVASIPHSSSNWGDIKTYGSYAYAVNETGGGLDVIDLSQVDSGVVTLVQRVTDGGLSTCHNIAVDEESGYLYLCSPDINQGRLVALDLADPADPVIAGSLAAEHNGVSHDAQVVTYTSGPFAGRQIAFSSSGTDGLEIYDVTDKAAMFVVTTATYPNEVYSHQAWLSDDRQYLYLNDELDTVNETVIFDVSDIEDPRLVGTYSSGVPATDHNVFYHQGFIYEAEYRAGMRVFDASNPIAPVQVGWIDTFPGDDSEGSGGAWGVYPFFPSGKVLISDKNRAMFLVWPAAPPIQFAFDQGSPPDRVDPSGAAIGVTITPTGAQALDTSSAVLSYDYGAGPIETAMNHLGGDLFEAVFGSIPCGSLVQFHVRASTTEGVPVRLPASAPCSSFVAVAAKAATTVLADDLELGTGWIAGAPGDTAVAGLWTRVDPRGTDAQPETDHSAGSGTQCFVTGQGPPFGNIGDNDVDGGFATLTSPLLELAGSDKVTIAYWRWYHNSYSQSDTDEGNGPNEDILEVWITDDDGASWIPVETVGPVGPETAGGWFLHAFDAGTLVDLTDQVRLRFVASDAFAFSIVEAAIDDLLVVSISCDDSNWSPVQKLPRQGPDAAR